LLKTLPKKKIAILAGDIFVILASLYLTPLIRFGIAPDLVSAFSGVDAFALMTYLFFFYILDCYNFDYLFASVPFLLRMLLVPLFGNVCIVTISFILNVRPFGVSFLALQGLLVFVLALGWRCLVGSWLKNHRKQQRVIILGAGWAGRTLLRLLAKNKHYCVAGILDDNLELRGTPLDGVPVLGGTDRIIKLVDRGEIDVVVVAILRDIRTEVYRLLVEVKMRGIPVYEMPSFFEREAGKIPVHHVSDLWFVYMPITGVQRNIYNAKLKRLFDLGCSMVGLILLFPLLLLTAAAIRLDSAGPIFFQQKRIGLMGKPFQVLKFRSMRTGLENHRQFAGQRDDPRITKVGHIIRLFRIDELPQLWNVLKGEMSLIGPRALMEEEVRTFTSCIPYYSLRHSLRPGITGWAQVNYPHGVTENDALEKLQYDLFYIKNLSPVLELQIFMRTIRTVLFWKGAR